MRLDRWSSAICRRFSWLVSDPSTDGGGNAIYDEYSSG
jgi:hypothetical protein